MNRAVRTRIRYRRVTFRLQAARRPALPNGRGTCADTGSGTHGRWIDDLEIIGPFAPTGPKTQDSLGALIYELNLSQTQIEQVRWFFNQFSQKQGSLPTAVDVALQNRASIRQVITGAPFNQTQAQQLAQQVTSVATQRLVNRLELRNQIFQMLTPQQQQQYIQMIQRSLEGLE